MDGYLLLSMAVVAQAADDYRKAYKRKESLQHIKKVLAFRLWKYAVFWVGKENTRRTRN